jgi:biotin carboxylase
MSIAGMTLLVVGGGYPGKRTIYEKIAQLGVRIVIVDEPGHWSQALVDDGIAARWLAAPVTGDPEIDAGAVLAAVSDAAQQPDGVVTFWEHSICAAARVAAELELPGNPPESVDAARSKIRMREVSERLGLPTPRARRVRSLDELYAAAAEVGFPAVIKPEFGAAAVGCIRVDDFDALADLYTLVRGEIDLDSTGRFRAGSDLLIEEYLDGVEFDVDLVMHDGDCAFFSVSQNWPTAEPSFQETGLHCPPDHNARAVRALVALSVQTAQAFGLSHGVLHVEGKCTRSGPRIVEVNARMGGGRIHQMVEAIWGVDLVQAHVRGALGAPLELAPSRKPRCAVVDSILHAPASGRLVTLPFGELPADPAAGFAYLDVEAEVGDSVAGPERVFATVLAELYISGRNLRDARARAAEVFRERPLVRQDGPG